MATCTLGGSHKKANENERTYNRPVNEESDHRRQILLTDYNPRPGFGWDGSCRLRQNLGG